MILPIGHERGEVQRWPWVTFTIMGLCLVVFMITMPGLARHEQRQRSLLQETLEFFEQHPYLELDPRVVQRLGLPEDTAELAAELQQELGAAPPADAVERRREQQRLDDLAARWWAARSSHPFFRLGVIPSQLTWLSLLTYMFVHAGFLHLLGNLFILYLAGPAVEDVWGRPFFAVFYLAAGVLAALLYAAHHPGSTLPMVGASGAIAGVMGAFLVRFWNVKIEFFYFYWLIVKVYSGTFRAPAWLMLPLWFGSELLSAQATSNAGGDGGGVAYWAHVWGFLLGAAVAWGARALKVEERFLAPRLAVAAGVVENTLLEQAYEARNQGRQQEAWQLLERELGARPANREAAVALWDLAVQEGRAEAAAPRLVRCIWEELRSGDDELALQHWTEIQSFAPGVKLETGLKLRLAEVLTDYGREADARELADDLVAQAAALPALLLPRLVRLAQRQGPALAAAVKQRLAGRDDLTQELRELLGLAPGTPGGAAAARTAPAAGIATGVGPAGAGGTRSGVGPAASGGTRSGVGPAAAAGGSPAAAAAGGLGGAAGSVGRSPGAVQAARAPRPGASPRSGAAPSPSPPAPERTPGLAGQPAGLGASDGRQPTSTEGLSPPPPPPPAPERAPSRSPGALPPPAARPVATGAAAPPELAVMPAVATGLEERRLRIDLEGKGAMALRLDKIHGVGAAEVAAAGGRELVLDLLVDRPAAGARRLRLVRFLASTSDPRVLLDGAALGDPMQAFCALVGRLMSVSGQRFYPGGSARAPQQLPRFPSLSAYEAALGAALK